METLPQKIATTRIKDSQDEASAEARSVKEAERRRHREIRERNRLLWADHFDRMAASHARLAEDYEARAARLLEEPTGGGGGR